VYAVPYGPSSGGFVILSDCKSRAWFPNSTLCNHETRNAHVQKKNKFPGNISQENIALSNKKTDGWVLMSRCTHHHEHKEDWWKHRGFMLTM
jgi:hypothetical protein